MPAKKTATTSAKKAETSGDLVMHVHEKIAQVVVKRTMKIGENYESRELSMQVGTNGSAAEAYESIIETERALSELLDDMFGDIVFEKPQKPEEVVQEVFGDDVEVEELVVKEPEDEPFDPDSSEAEIKSDDIPSFFPIAREVWYRKSNAGENIRVKGFNDDKPWPKDASWEKARNAIWKWQRSVAPGKIAEWPREKRQYAYNFWQKIYRREFGEEFIPKDFSGKYG